MLNNVNLTGRLVRDPELRYTPSGVAVTTFTMAVDRDFKKEGQPDADFIPCVCWRKTAESIANFFRKGKPITIKGGRIQTRSYDKQDGSGKAFVTEVMFDQFDFALTDNTREGAGGGSAAAAGSRNNQQQDPFQDDGRPIDISDDDLPF